MYCKWLFPIVLLLLLSSCKEKKNVNDWGKMNLMGKVRAIKEQDYFIDTTGENKGKILRWNRYYAFDTEGRLTDKVLCNEKGDTISQIVFVYNNTGQLTKQTEYAGGELKYVSAYTYNKIGNNITITRYSGDSLDICTTSYEYDNAGLCTADVTGCTKDQVIEDSMPRHTIGYKEYNYYKYNTNKQKTWQKRVNIDSMIQVTIYSYDDNGYCISEITDTCLPHQPARIERKFDKQGNLTEEIAYDNNKVLYQHKRIEYLQQDTKANWTVRKISWHDLGVTQEERSIVYY